MKANTLISLCTQTIVTIIFIQDWSMQYLFTNCALQGHHVKTFQINVNDCQQCSFG